MYKLNELHNAIASFNRQFNTDVHAELSVYTESIKVKLIYNNNTDSTLYFNSIQEAINNINETFDIWSNS